MPRVESYEGLIFGSFNSEVAPLDQYLGNMRFYLDNYFARFAGGVEVISAPHKWRLAANWKLPVENQLGDVGHGPFLHGAILGGSDAVAEIEAYGFNMVPEPGHGAAMRRALAARPAGLGLAGAAYQGVGVPACIAQARAAVDAVLGDSAAGGTMTS